MDLQHNRSMLHHIDNKFLFAFLFDSPPLFYSGTSRRTILRCDHAFAFCNSWSFIDCTSYHILTDQICSVASISLLICYYIVISLHNNIYSSCSLSLFLVCDNTFPHADFDRISSFLSLLQIKMSSQHRTIYSFMLSFFHFLIHSLCVHSCLLMNFICFALFVRASLISTKESFTAGTFRALPTCILISFLNLLIAVM